MKDWEAVGVCGIHAEMFKAGGQPALNGLHILLRSVWNSGVITANWKKGLVVPFWKRRVTLGIATSTEYYSPLGVGEDLR